MKLPIASAFFALGYFFLSLASLPVIALLPPSRLRRIYQGLEARETRARLEAVKDFLNKGDKVLDVGCGTGRFGRALADELGVSVAGVDIQDYSEEGIPVQLYDGLRLPFPDKSFEVVLFAFVLHHLTDQETALREACRVARHRVLVLEDSYRAPWERWFVCWNDYHTNILQGRLKARKGLLSGNPALMPMPYRFRRSAEWLVFFEKFPLELKSRAIRRSGHKPLLKVTFCLEVVDKKST